MNKLTTWIGISLTCFTAFTASAESIRCDSPQVRISGDFNSTYVRMGKSRLNGRFTIMLRDSSNSVTTSQVLVIDGSTQDDRDLFFYEARDQLGRAVTLDLDLTASRMSSVRINNSETSFFARCAWSNTPIQPAPSSYHQHNTH